MKSLTRTLVIAAALAIPAVSFAQTDSPANAQATQGVAATSYGGTADGSGAAGASTQGNARHHLFGFAHRNGNHSQSSDTCVGPVSYCNIFFGS
jgi:hypothetical protein